MLRRTLSSSAAPLFLNFILWVILLKPWINFGQSFIKKCRLAIVIFSLLRIAQANLAANYRPDDPGRSRGHQSPHPPLRDCLQEAAVTQVVLSRANMLKFRIANNKLSEWLLSRVLASHAGGPGSISGWDMSVL